MPRSDLRLGLDGESGKGAACAESCCDNYSARDGRFPPEVITLSVRWYLRFGLSYRDVEELLAERGIEVDHVSIFPVGAALHAAAGGGGTPVPTPCRRPLVG